MLLDYIIYITVVTVCQDALEMAKATAAMMKAEAMTIIPTLKAKYEYANAVMKEQIENAEKMKQVINPLSLSLSHTFTLHFIITIKFYVDFRYYTYLIIYM